MISVAISVILFADAECIKKCKRSISALYHESLETHERDVVR